MISAPYSLINPGGSSCGGSKDSSSLPGARGQWARRAAVRHKPPTAEAVRPQDEVIRGAGSSTANVNRDIHVFSRERTPTKSLTEPCGECGFNAVAIRAAREACLRQPRISPSPDGRRPNEGVALFLRLRLRVTMAACVHVHVLFVCLPALRVAMIMYVCIIDKKV